MKMNRNTKVQHIGSSRTFAKPVLQIGYFKFEYLYINKNKKKQMELRKFIKTTIKEYLNEKVNSDGYIYHGTGKGQALNIQRDGYMKPNKTGEEQPSISFTNDLDYAKYYAKSKGGVSKMCILRTKLTDDYQLSSRIMNNKGDEYITFKNVPSSELEVMTMSGGWQPLNTWNVIFDEPLNA